MRFDRIRLEHFKCYEQTDLRLNAGVTVIHGLNGSGKSTLLEACFFALYGAKALDKTLEEIVTIGAEETTVELWFTHAGESYHVKRRIRVSSGDARTAECVLEGPDGTFEGATDVREQVVHLLRMDTDAFVNCAYVRQGEVNKLINASPADRQDMLDDLLQLGKLEEYRERASDARVGVGRVRDDKQGALGEIEEQIAEKEDKDLYDTLNALEAKHSEVESDIERFEENREEAEATRDDAETVLEEYEEKQSELAELVADIEELREKIETTERERERLADEIEAKRDRLSTAESRQEDLLAETDIETADPEVVEQRTDELETEIEELTEQIREHSVEKNEAETEAETLADRADELETEAEEKREQAADLETDIEDGESLVEKKREQLDELEAEITAHREAFEDAPVDVGAAAAHREELAEKLADVREQRAETEAEHTNAKERLAEAQELQEAGKCPECGQPVEASPHVEAIEQRQEAVDELESKLESHRKREETLAERLERVEALAERESEIERLENDLENATQLIEEKAATLDEKREAVETHREEATELAAEAEQKREAAAESREQATETQEEIAACNQRKATRKADIERLESLVETIETRTDLAETIDDLREERAEKAEMNDERRDHLSDKRERRADLEAAFDEERVEEARAEKERAENYIEKVTAKLADLEERQAELQGDIGGVKAEIEELETLRARREHVDQELEQLESLYEEAEQLEAMYGQLRAELRQRNIESLERMVNETFELVYENDTYSRIELDGEYRLTVYQKDGESLDPEQLSGGERALFNLSLRCAIYQLLAEGIEGTAPMPPLILDEPTVFLDSGHVSQLVELVDAMREMGVEQILVVSHDEELVAAADDLVTVRKDSTTNRSTVERRGEQVAIEADD